MAKTWIEKRIELGQAKLKEAVKSKQIGRMKSHFRITRVKQEFHRIS